MIDLKLLSDAHRLDLISQRVGLALWKLQELEGVVATYLVISTRAQRGMGEFEGNKLLDDALAKSFGRTIKDLRKAGKLPAYLDQPVDDLLEQRNWLVHRSQNASRSAVRREVHCIALLEKIDDINDSALAMIKAFGQLVEEFALSHGLPQTYVDAETAKILKKWHAGDEPQPRSKRESR
jgi:hypothetical protein